MNLEDFSDNFSSQHLEFTLWLFNIAMENHGKSIITGGENHL
jgi:hypothetical protein